MGKSAGNWNASAKLEQTQPVKEDRTRTYRVQGRFEKTRSEEEDKEVFMLRLVNTEE